MPVEEQPKAHNSFFMVWCNVSVNNLHRQFVEAKQDEILDSSVRLSWWRSADILEKIMENFSQCCWFVVILVKDIRQQTTFSEFCRKTEIVRWFKKLWKIFYLFSQRDHWLIMTHQMLP